MSIQDLSNQLALAGVQHVVVSAETELTKQAKKTRSAINSAATLHANVLDLKRMNKQIKALETAHPDLSLELFVSNEAAYKSRLNTLIQRNAK